MKVELEGKKEPDFEFVVYSDVSYDMPYWYIPINWDYIPNTGGKIDNNNRRTVG